MAAGMLLPPIEVSSPASRDGDTSVTNAADALQRRPMTVNERKAKSRRKKKADDRIAAALVDVGRLAPWDEANSAARESAFRLLIEDWADTVTRDETDPVPRVKSSESKLDHSSVGDDRSYA